MESFFEFPDHILEFVRKNVNKEDIESIEKGIAYLKENKISQLRTVILLKTVCDLPLNKANEYVYNSKAWNN